MSSRPVWATQEVQGQPKLHSKGPQKTKTKLPKLKIRITIILINLEAIFKLG